MWDKPGSPERLGSSFTLENPSIRTMWWIRQTVCSLDIKQQSIGLIHADIWNAYLLYQWYYSVRSEQYHWLLTIFNETHNMLWLSHSESILTSQKLSGISKSKYQLMYLKLLRSSETNNYINHDFIRHKWWSLLRRNVVVCIVDIGEKFTHSDYPFGIFKFFLPSLCKLSFHNLFSERLKQKCHKCLTLQRVWRNWLGPRKDVGRWILHLWWK